MSESQTNESFIDDQLSVDGHTALYTVNHDTGDHLLRCDDCNEKLGRFAPGRWREKHMDEAWQKHLGEQVTTDTRPKPTGAELAEQVETVREIVAELAADEASTNTAPNSAVPDA